MNNMVASIFLHVQVFERARSKKDKKFSHLGLVTKSYFVWKEETESEVLNAFSVIIIQKINEDFGNRVLNLLKCVVIYTRCQT